MFALNDLHDLPSDGHNPRKSAAPLVTGALTPADLRRCVRVLGLVLATALYLPTTVMDLVADRAAGYATAAVRWSASACYRAGLVSWAVASAAWLACCHLDVFVARDSWLVQTVATPLLVALYADLARRPSIPRLAGGRR